VSSEQQHDHDVLYQQQLQAQELCRLCAIWQRKVRSLPRGHYNESWGPLDEDVQASAMFEVTGSWVEVDSSDEETSDGGDDDTDIDDPDWVDCEDDESNGELMESLEAVALSDQYHVDDATDLTYSLSGMSVEHGSNMSPSKRTRSVF
jgi:hypothetical protein